MKKGFRFGSLFIMCKRKNWLIFNGQIYIIVDYFKGVKSKIKIGLKTNLKLGSNWAQNWAQMQKLDSQQR